MDISTTPPSYASPRPASSASIQLRNVTAPVPSRRSEGVSRNPSESGAYVPGADVLPNFQHHAPLGVALRSPVRCHVLAPLDVAVVIRSVDASASSPNANVAPAPTTRLSAVA